jgi:hypothetical protein
MKWMNFPLNNQRYVQLDVVVVKVVGEAERTIGFERFGREKTELNRTEINRFELVFDSVQKIKKIKSI